MYRKIIILILIIFLLDIIIIRNFKRYNYYKLAKQKSIEKNKKLMVIGSNHTGGISSRLFHSFNLYGCGDVCIDTLGCKKCNNSIKDYIENVLPKLPDNSHVIFLSAVLEYVDDLPPIIKELERVSGGDLYIVTINNLIDIPHLGSYYESKSKSILKRKWNIVKSPPSSKEWSYYKV